MKPFIVGVTGYAQSGKDTFASGLIKELGFKKVSFADALRRDIQVLNPIVDTSGLRYNQVLLEFGYELAKKEFPEVRRLLQVYGTEVHRAIDVDYWVRRASDSLTDQTVPGYVFTDMRFENERHGVDYDLTVRIERPGVGPLNDHASEMYVGEMMVDRVVQNTGDMEALADTAVSIVSDLI